MNDLETRKGIIQEMLDGSKLMHTSDGSLIYWSKAATSFTKKRRGEDWGLVFNVNTIAEGMYKVYTPKKKYTLHRHFYSSTNPNHVSPTYIETLQTWEETKPMYGMHQGMTLIKTTIVEQFEV